MCQNCCALASLITVAVMGTFAFSIEFNNVEKPPTAETPSKYAAANVFHNSLHAKIESLPNFSRKHHRPDWYPVKASPYEQSHLKKARPQRRQLAKTWCTLYPKCRSKAFKDCDFTGCQHYTGLYLADRDLRGALPQDLQSLTKLSTLNLGGNKLDGDIRVLGNLSQLQTLNLRHNKFTGSVEALGNLSKLDQLNLHKNGFTGSVEALGKLTQLTLLFLGRNKFTGSVETLGKLTKLKEMNLYDNKFTGSVEALGNLGNMEDLRLYINGFTGSVEALGKLTQLTRLSSYANEFTGSVEALGNLTKLKLLRIQGNRFTGSVEALSKLTQLTNLSLDSNQFNGTVSALGKLKQLTQLRLQYNKFTGSVEALGQLSKLDQLWLRANGFTGSVEALGKLTKLRQLFIGVNDFSGNIRALGNLNQLEKLWLDQNNFTGSVAALGNLTNVERLYLGSNNFDGRVEGLEKLSRLTRLDLNDNNFEGTIDFLGKFTELKQLYIDNNNFSGTLQVFDSLTQLQALSISNGGKFRPPVPKDLLQAQPRLTGLSAALHGLGLICKWAGGDGLPSLSRQSDYVGIDATEKLQCPDPDFPVLTNGSLHPIIVKDHLSCEDANYSVIPTKAECQEAAIMEGLSRTSMTDASRSMPYTPYCGFNHNLGYYSFDTTGKNRGISHCDSEDYLSCLCKKAPEHPGIKCVYSERDGKAMWEPNIDKLKCLGYGACQTDDATARKLRDTSGADVTACTTLQDGDYCSDYECKKRKSHVRNPERNTIRCKSSVWDEPDKSYCIFCPPGEHKVVEKDDCEACSAGKFLVSSDTNDFVTCTNCPMGKYQPDQRGTGCISCTVGRYQDEVGQAECKNCPVGRYHSHKGQIECEECPTGQHQPATGQLKCKQCASGEYQDKKGQSVCKKCPFGQYQNENGQPTCILCMKGHQCVTTENEPEPCLEGHYQNDTGQIQCKVCPEGRHQNDKGQIECEECPTGHQCFTTENKPEPCSEGHYQNDTGQIQCKVCPEGRHQNNKGQIECEECPTGQHQSATGKLNCKQCASGEYQDKKGQSMCKKCPFGQYQNENGQPTCILCMKGHQCVTIENEPEPCSEGHYQNDTGQIQCKNCPVGRYQDKKRQETCKPCAKGHYCARADEQPQQCPVGRYQNDTGQIQCKVCPEGRYQNEKGQIECEECHTGQHQSATGQVKCKQCGSGEYQDKTGQSMCTDCAWYMWCVEKNIGDPSISPLVFVIPLVLMALIFPIYKVVTFIIQAVTAWKPQSKVDAALAKRFVVPKTSAEMVPSVAALKACQEHFVAEGWTDKDLNTIKEHYQHVVRYLGKRVQEACHDEQIRIMQCCLKMDALYDFKMLYDTTMKNIHNKERGGFDEYTTSARRIHAAASTNSCPRNPSGLIDLYNSGRAAYERFHAFIAQAAHASDSAYVYKSHDRKPGMKGIYRVLEKGVFKYNDDTTEDLDFSRVQDLVRGGIIDTTMQGLSAITNYIHASNEVTVCRVKDRFNYPSPSGWTDLMVNFYLNDDPGKHVCEVQLIHFKMLSQRTTQEGHDAYNVYRAASELLVKANLRLNPHPELVAKVRHMRSSFRSLLASMDFETRNPRVVVPLCAVGPMDSSLTEKESV